MRKKIITIFFLSTVIMLGSSATVQGADAVWVENFPETEEKEQIEWIDEGLCTREISFEEGCLLKSQGEQAELAVTDALGNIVFTQIVQKDKASTGLQNMLDYIRDNAAAENPMTIVIPAGTYQIQNTLYVYSNTTLKLSEGAVLKRVKKKVLLRFGRMDEETTGYDGYRNITIAGPDDGYGVFDGNGMGTSMVRFAHAGNITIRNIRFTNVDKTHHMEFAASENVTIASCVFDGFASSDYTGRSNYEALQLDILWPGHFGSYGAYDETINRNITITGNSFENVSRGIGTHSAETGKYMTNIVIKNNQFKNIMGYAIATVNFAESEISDNKIENCGSGILFRHMIWDPGINYYAGDVNAIRTDLKSVISGNQITISNTGTELDTYGIYAHGEIVAQEKNWTSGGETGTVPAGDYQVKGLAINGNILNLYHNVPGIRLVGTTQSVIEKNQINEYADDAQGGAFAVFMQKSCENEITENVIANKAGEKSALVNAVQIADNSSRNVLRGNSIDGARNYGINVENATENIITENDIQNIGIAGITVQNTSYTDNKTEITKNKLNKTGKNGIYGLDKTNMTVTGNSILNCSQFGVYFGQGSKGIVKDNVFKNCEVSKVCIFKDKQRMADPGKAKIKKISVQGKKVKLTWKKQKTVKKCTIYRSTKKNGTYKKIASVSGTKYIDKKVKKGRQYYYKIMPETKIGKVTVYGEMSPVKSVKVKK